MNLKTVLFDFNGVIVNDESIHQALIEEILLGENLRTSAQEYREVCLGRNNRTCLSEILSCRGRVVSEDYLNQLLANKAVAFKQQLEQLEKLPIYPGLADLISQLQATGLVMGVVSGALREEVELILNHAELAQFFSAIVAGDELPASKPAPEGYLLAVERLNQKYPDLQLQPSNCLVIEDTLTGIEAAKRAEMQVVGVANTYPFHMLQRQAHWTVDHLGELELERVEQVFSEASSSARMSEC